MKSKLLEYFKRVVSLSSSIAALFICFNANAYVEDQFGNGSHLLYKTYSATIEEAMNICIETLMACASEDVPDEDSMRHWVSAAMRDESATLELSVQIVDEQESAALNQQYPVGCPFYLLGLVLIYFLIHHS